MQLTQRNLKRLEQEDSRCKYQRIQMFVQDQKQILASSAYENIHLAPSSPSSSPAKAMSKPRRKKTAERTKKQATRQSYPSPRCTTPSPPLLSSSSCHSQHQQDDVRRGFSIRRKISALSSGGGNNEKEDTQPMVKLRGSSSSTAFWLFSKFLCISTASR